MNTKNITIKHLAIFSVVLQIVTMLLWFIPLRIFGTSIGVPLLFSLLIFYFFYFFVAITKFFDEESPYREFRLKNFGFLLLTFPLLYGTLFLSFYISDNLNSTPTSAEDIELYKVENNTLTKIDSVSISNGGVTVRDSMAVILKNDTIKFKLNR